MKKEIDLIKLLKKMPSIENVVFKAEFNRSPWPTWLINNYRSVTFEFNGFELHLYGGDKGYNSGEKHNEDGRAVLRLSHKASLYARTQVIPMIEANNILGKILIKDYLCVSNQEQIENFILKLCE